MIENIRKYTGLIIVVIVVLVLGFIFMDTSGVFRSNSAAGRDMIRIEGQTYGEANFNKLSRDTLRIIETVSRTTQQTRGFDIKVFELTGFAQTLIGNVQGQDVALQNFFASRVVLQDAFAEFGIHPSEEEINGFIEELAIFRTPPPIGSPPGTSGGEFDQKAFNEFIDRGIKESELRALVRDVIATEKLREIIGNGLTVDREFAKATAIIDQQQIEVSASSIDIENFRKDIQPSEEDLKTFWEEVKDGYMTEQRIKVSYFIASPQYPEDDAEVPAEEESEEQTEEEKQAAEKEKAAEKLEKEEARKKIDAELAGSVAVYADALIQSEGEDFEELLKKNDWELKQSDWFTRNSVPADLKVTTRGPSSNSNVTNMLFELQMGPDKLAPFTDPAAIADGKWIGARLDEIEETRVKTFEEAREEIEKRYIEEKADEALRKHVGEKLELIRKALEDGKSFADAAKESGLESTDLGPFGPSDTLSEGYSARDLFPPASIVNPGELAEPVYTDKQAIILFVRNRQIIKDDNRGSQIDGAANRLAAENARLAFDAWLTRRLTNAEVIDLTKS